MKLSMRLLLLFIILLAGTAYWYWTENKNSLLSHFIKHTVDSQTDSLYYIRYDSSMIDETKGDAYFSNVYLQSDTDQQTILKGTDSLPNVLINIYIKSVTAQGLDMEAYLSNNELHATKIIIDHPRIQLINTGANQLKKEDTISVYKKMVAQFKSIHADSILIRNGVFISKNRKGEIQTELSNADIELTRFKVDSTHDYSNVMSYFLDNIKTSAENLRINRKKQNGYVELSKLSYNSTEKSLAIDKIRSCKGNEKTVAIELHQITLKELNINEFIYQHKIETGQLSCMGGFVTLYTNKEDSSTVNLKNKSFDFPETFFDEIKIGSVHLGNTNLIVRSRQSPEKKPIIISNLRFDVKTGTKVVEGNSIRHMIDHAQWQMNADGFSMTTPDNLYTVSVEGLKFNRQHSSALIKRIRVTPNLTEAQYSSLTKSQRDYYKIDIQNIRLRDINFTKLLDEFAIEIGKAAMEVDFRDFIDRLLPANQQSKIGKYPQQLLIKLGIPLMIKQVAIEHSLVSYREKARETKQTGELQFKEVSATIDNLTNIPACIRKNPVCAVKAHGLFQGKAQASTEWKLMLNSADGAFGMKGKLEHLEASLFNGITKPLSMTSMDGYINSLDFVLTGNDLKAQGNLLLLYKNMNIESLKMDTEGDTLKRKAALSYLSNLLLINNNPSDGKTRSADFSSVREPTKSLFNLVWKSVLDGMMETAFGTQVAGIQKKMKETAK